MDLLLLSILPTPFLRGVCYRLNEFGDGQRLIIPFMAFITADLFLSLCSSIILLNGINKVSFFNFILKKICNLLISYYSLFSVIIYKFYFMLS